MFISSFLIIRYLTIQIWNMMESKDLFVDLKDENGQYNTNSHLSQMIALLGDPPKALLKQERLKLVVGSCFETHANTLVALFLMTTVRFLHTVLSEYLC